MSSYYSMTLRGLHQERSRRAELNNNQQQSLHLEETRKSSSRPRYSTYCTSSNPKSIDQSMTANEDVAKPSPASYLRAVELVIAAAGLYASFLTWLVAFGLWATGICNSTVCFDKGIHAGKDNGQQLQSRR